MTTFRFLLFICLTFSFLLNDVSAKSLTEQLKAKKEESSKKLPKDVKEVMAKANKELEKQRLGTRLPNVGDRFPAVSLYDEKKNSIKLQDFWKDGYAVIKFYRGHWCPYCQLELKAYQDRVEKFKKLNAKIVVLTPDTYRYIKKTKEKFKLTFPVLQDVNNLFAQQLGIAFTLNNDVVEVYKSFKIDLASSQANRYNKLPLPATYVVDKNGRVIYKFANADYTLRADPEEVLDIIKAKNKGKKNVRKK